MPGAGRDLAGRPRGTARDLRPLVALATATLLLNASVGLVKTVIGRLGPLQLGPAALGPGGSAVFAHGTIFPSGHAANAVVTWGLLAWLARAHRRLWGIAAGLLAASVGLTTLYLGTHWVSDVLAGWVAGGLVLLAVPAATARTFRLARRLRIRRPQARMRAWMPTLPGCWSRSSPHRSPTCCCAGVPSSASAPSSSNRTRHGRPPAGPDRIVAGFDELDDELRGGAADVVVTDHHRDELGELLRDALARPARWVGVMGNPRHEGPHVAALTALGVPPEEIARVHRPIGLDIGSRAPAEIAVSTLAGLLADRNGRSGGFAHGR